LERKKPMRRQAQQLRQKARKARVDTGPTWAQRELVIDRALGCCEICGRILFDERARVVGPYSVHHRQPRGMGGSSRREINSPANLLLLCGDATTPGGCHAHVESNRALAYGNGWLVRASADPAEVPVLLAGGDWYRLTDDGDRMGAGGAA
jgi:hypothetical protein